MKKIIIVDILRVINYFLKLNMTRFKYSNDLYESLYIKQKNDLNNDL